MIEEIVKELSRKYSKKKKIIEILFEVCNECGYDIEETKKIIEDYLLINKHVSITT